MTYPWAVLVMRNLEDSQREIQLLSKYGAEYPLGLLLPSLDCSPEAVLHLSPQSFSLHFLSIWRFVYARRLAALVKSLPTFGGMSITVKYTAHVIPTSS